MSMDVRARGGRRRTKRKRGKAAESRLEGQRRSVRRAYERQGEKACKDSKNGKKKRRFRAVFVICAVAHMKLFVGFLLAERLHALFFGKDAFAQADSVRRDLHKLVVLDELHGLLQTEHRMRHQTQRII